jgi:hypothetical protein
MVWRDPAKPRFHPPYVIDVIELLSELFRPASGDETILPGDETVSRFGADTRKQPLVISLIAKTADSAGIQNGDSHMRTLSFILALAFVVAGASFAGSSEAGLPGIGTFAYNGSPIAASATQAIVVAVR